MSKESCKNCRNVDFSRKEELSGRLTGKYRYGCRFRKSGYTCGAVVSDEALEFFCCNGYCGTVIKEKDQDLEKLLTELDHRMEVLFDRWILWKEQGAPGVDATDGEYLNRLRTGLERLRKKMEGCAREEDYSENYYAPLPPKMDVSYMANAEQMKQQAGEIWKAYQENLDYQWLALHYPAMKKRKNDKDYENAGKLLSCVAQLKKAIEQGEALPIKKEIQQRDLTRAFHLCRTRLESRKKTDRKRTTAGADSGLKGQMDFEQLKAS